MFVHWLISQINILMSYVLCHTDTKSSKTSQSHRETPQNGRFCTVPTVEAKCKNLPKIYKKYASSYHTQTGYIWFLFKTYQFCLKPIIFCLKPIVFCFKPIVFCLKQKSMRESTINPRVLPIVRLGI